MILIHDALNEQLTLGLMMNSQEALNRGLSEITEEYFSDQNNQMIFKAMGTLNERGKDIDLYSLKTELGKMNVAISLEDILNIEDRFYVPEKFDSLVESLTDAFKRRRTLKNIKVLEEKLKNDIQPFDAIAGQFGDVIDDSSVGNDTIVNTSNFIEFREKLIEQKAIRKPILTGYETLDEIITYKLVPGEISVIGARPSNGKCLRGDTLINTKTGIKLLKDIKIGDEVVSINNEKKLTYRKVLNTVYSGKKQLFEMKLSGLSYKIEPSSNHPFFTFNGWKQLSDLNIEDDVIAIPRRLIMEDGIDLYNKDFCRLVGYLLGDGNFRESPRFVTQNPFLLEDIEKILFSLYGNEVVMKDKLRSNGVVSISMSKGFKNCHIKNKLNIDLDKLGLTGKVKGEKFIPLELLTSKENIRNLIIGLWETDGSATGFSIGSKDIRDKLHLLLLYFGIITSKSERYPKCNGKICDISYRLGLTDKESILNFWNEIGRFMSPSGKKGTLLTRMVEEVNEKSNFRKYPKEVWNIIQEYITIKEIFKYSGRNSHGNVIRAKNQTIGEAYLQKIIDIIIQYKRVIPEKLIQLTMTDLIFLKIEHIKPTTIEDTYDLEIDIDHNFIADGILVHNSAFKTNLIRNMCTSGVGVASFALEQTKEVEMDRMDSIDTNIPLQAISNINKWVKTDPRWERVHESWRKQKEWNFHLLDGNGKSIKQLISICKRLKKDGVQILFFDLWDRIDEVIHSVTNKPQRVTSSLGRLLTAAKELEMHFCLLSQINRTSVKRKDLRPKIEDLKDSGGYEEVGRLIMLMHYPKFYDHNLASSVIELEVAKQSNGPCRTVEIDFNSQSLRMSGINIKKIELKKPKGKEDA